MNYSKYTKDARCDDCYEDICLKIGDLASYNTSLAVFRGMKYDVKNNVSRGWY
jgi:hypothetical protein